MIVRKKPSSRRGPRPMLASAGPMLPVLTAISFCGGVCFLHDADEDARQSLVEIRGRHQLRPRVVVSGKVGT